MLRNAGGVAAELPVELSIIKTGALQCIWDVKGLVD